MKEWRQMLKDIKRWAEEAGEEQIKRLEHPLQMHYKTSEIDLVTEADEWTDRFFMEKIREAYPSHAIHTEESGKHKGNELYEWVIDPIDGTVNYAHGFPLFCISVAVKYRGETVIGVVYVPKLSEMYEAVKGEGAFLNGKKLHVSKTERLPQAVLATGFPYDKATDPDNNVKQFNAVITKIGGIRRTGSAAFDLCQVAAGRFDGYWEYKLNPWDIEAGLLIVQEAGGKTKRVESAKGTFVLVGGAAIFKQIEALFEQI